MRVISTKTKRIFAIATTVWLLCASCGQSGEEVSGSFDPTKPWVFWYWRQAAISKAGITADLEAMKAVGIGGAYLMPIQGAVDPPHMDPPIVQLTPKWWEMVLFAFTEARRLGLQLGMHASDGFALAGGPWITPELSMQKVVWSETQITGGKIYSDTLPVPEHYGDYYKDIAVYAYPSGREKNIYTEQPKVTSSDGSDVLFMAEPGNTEVFKCDEPCWIQYEFDEPFTSRSIRVATKGNNFQSHRFLVKTSNDGVHFTEAFQMVPPRHGWQDTDEQVTYSIPATTARFFRFYYDPEGSEPGAEDLDAAKWRPRLRTQAIQLSNAPKLHQYEGKSGAVWRISPRTTDAQVPDSVAVPLDEIIDLTSTLDSSGVLRWEAPPGHWTILRMGHTSTGHTNYTGGGALGLECDKLNPEAIHLQFDNWFGRIIDSTGVDLAREVLKIFHVDSWECGSQNWSPVLREGFSNRRGYDPLPFLPVMSGLPVGSADQSERFLYDLRQTIVELTNENFYGILAARAWEEGCRFSAESVAPTMLSDGMRHYDYVDLPMGEFWLHSPTHDKLNDMLDAISGAHVYGKQVIQAEAFTTLRMTWDEHPGMLKALGDRNLALGINRFVFHVFTHNPWIDRKPGMTLDGVGLYFQRDQTWWKEGRAWMDYMTRCQELLQEGTPVADVAVFTGEELPRRAILPDRLVTTLPGIYGLEVVEREQLRLANKNLPLRQLPEGVTHSANMSDPEMWIDPLRGYKYDSFNKDALIRLAKVEEGDIVLSGGGRYKILVLPGARRMNPDADNMSVEVAEKLHQLVEAGATILVSGRPTAVPGLTDAAQEDQKLAQITGELWDGTFEKIGDGHGNVIERKQVGKGEVVKTPYYGKTFEKLGVVPDLLALSGTGHPYDDVAWTHRKTVDADIYFVSNQSDNERTIIVSVRDQATMPELHNPVSNERWMAVEGREKNDRLEVPVRLDASGSLFLIFRADGPAPGSKGSNWRTFRMVSMLAGPWEVSFDPAVGGPEGSVLMDSLISWKDHPDSAVQFYSGSAEYVTTFDFSPREGQRYWLSFEEIHNVGSVQLNGVGCGAIWTRPYRVEVTDALQSGENRLRVTVTNTWHNRLIGDRRLPEADRITWTTAPFRLEGHELLDGGLVGEVKVMEEAR